MVRKDSTRGDVVRAHFDYPSAVVTPEPGRYFAVLDNSTIKLYDHRNKAFLDLVSNNKQLNSRGMNFFIDYIFFIGLGVTSAGDLVTITQPHRSHGPTIDFYSTKEQNKVIKCIIIFSILV